MSHQKRCKIMKNFLSIFCALLIVLGANAIAALASAPTNTLTAVAISEIPSSIASNFNGTNIRAGNYIWFNSVVNVKNRDTTKTTVVNVINAKITFAANGTNYVLPVPDSVITFSPGVTTS